MKYSVVYFNISYALKQMVYAYLEDVEPFFRHRKNTCIHLCYIAALSFQWHFDFSMQKYIYKIQADFYSASSFCSCFGTTAILHVKSVVNKKNLLTWRCISILKPLVRKTVKWYSFHRQWCLSVLNCFVW